MFYQNQSSVMQGPDVPKMTRRKNEFHETRQAIAGTYLQTPLRLPKNFPIGQWNIFK